VSDRQEEVLNHIDAALDGAVDWGADFDDEHSDDAMTWQPPEAIKDPATEMADWVEATTGNHLHPYQVQMLSGILALGDARPVFETRGRNVMGPRMHSSDSIPVRISPGEAMIPGPNGPIHVVGWERLDPQALVAAVNQLREEATFEPSCACTVGALCDYHADEHTALKSRMFDMVNLTCTCGHLAVTFLGSATDEDLEAKFQEHLEETRLPADDDAEEADS
jgi:hypothetical protein